MIRKRSPGGETIGSMKDGYEKDLLMGGRKLRGRDLDIMTDDEMHAVNTVLKGKKLSRNEKGVIDYLRKQKTNKAKKLVTKRKPSTKKK